MKGSQSFFVLRFRGPWVGRVGMESQKAPFRNWGGERDKSESGDKGKKRKRGWFFTKWWSWGCAPGHGNTGDVKK